MPTRKSIHPRSLNLRLQRMASAVVLLLYALATPLHGRPTHPSRVSRGDAALLPAAGWQAAGSGSCGASDAQLQHLQAIVCRSLACSPSCPCRNVTAEGDWPNQVRAAAATDLLSPPSPPVQPRRRVAQRPPHCHQAARASSVIVVPRGGGTDRDSHHKAAAPVCGLAGGLYARPAARARGHRAGLRQHERR